MFHKKKNKRKKKKTNIFLSTDSHTQLIIINNFHVFLINRHLLILIRCLPPFVINKQFYIIPVFEGNNILVNVLFVFSGNSEWDGKFCLSSLKFHCSLWMEERERAWGGARRWKILESFMYKCIVIVLTPQTLNHSSISRW